MIVLLILSWFVYSFQKFWRCGPWCPGFTSGSGKGGSSNVTGRRQCVIEIRVQPGTKLGTVSRKIDGGIVQLLVRHVRPWVSGKYVAQYRLSPACGTRAIWIGWK